MLLTLLLACAGHDKDDTGAELPAVSDATLTPSAAVVTVATLTWSTDEPLRCSVVFGDSDALRRVPLEDEAATTHSAVLVGARADAEQSWTIEDEDGHALARGTWITDPLPRDVRVPELSGDPIGATVLTTMLGLTSGALLLAPDGQVLWYHLEESGLDTYRALLAPDGSGVWYSINDLSGDPEANDGLVQVSWDGATVDWLSIPNLSHDVALLPDGTLAASVFEYREDGAETIKGDQIIEISPDGAQTQVWSAWSCYDPQTDPGDGGVLGWTWANALDYLEDSDQYLLSVHNMDTFLWIDRASGECVRELGGAYSDYTLDGSDWHHEHQFELQDGALLLFDNEGAGTRTSRALEFALDDGTGVASEIWSYTPSPGLYSYVLGDVARLDDGERLLMFSLNGEIDRVSADGTLLGHLNGTMGYAFGFMTVLPESWGLDD